MLTADLLEPLRLGVLIALIVTAVAPLLAIRLRHALAPPAFPRPALLLLALLMPPALPQLPGLASATRAVYRWGLARAITPGARPPPRRGALTDARVPGLLRPARRRWMTPGAPRIRRPPAPPPSGPPPGATAAGAPPPSPCPTASGTTRAMETAPPSTAIPL